MGLRVVVKRHSMLRAERRKARIQAKDVADELGIDSGALSRFELYGAPLPHGLGESDYHTALTAIDEGRKHTASGPAPKPVS